MRACTFFAYARAGRQLAELAQPPAQLACGSGSECHGENPARIGPPGRRQVSDAVRHCPGLAGARAGQHAYRAAVGKRDLPLLGIEAGQDAVRPWLLQGAGGSAGLPGIRKRH